MGHPGNHGCMGQTWTNDRCSEFDTSQGLSSGNLLTVCYWKWTIEIVDLPIDSMVIFQFVMLVYQRVTQTILWWCRELMLFWCNHFICSNSNGQWGFKKQQDLERGIRPCSELRISHPSFGVELALTNLHIWMGLQNGKAPKNPLEESPWGQDFLEFFASGAPSFMWICRCCLHGLV